jgi:hypothetical protein
MPHESGVLKRVFMYGTYAESDFAKAVRRFWYKVQDVIVMQRNCS